MSKQHLENTLTIVLSAGTSMAVGTFVLQALGAFLLGITGALAGWFFTSFIRPKLESWRKDLGHRKDDKKAQ